MAVDVARPDISPPKAGSPRRTALVVLGGLAAVAVVVRVADPERIAWLQNFLIIFGALLVEATPFVLLGAFVSAAIEVFVPTSTFAHLGRLPGPLQLPAAALAGIAFPVCECGSVPVARRLARKGLAPSAAITFMLAAPILNPVVVASTFVAYRGRDSLWIMVLGRMGLGFLVAVAVGWVIGDTRKEDLLKPRPDDDDVDAEAGEHESRWARFISHLSGDFFFMGRFLVMGAAIAAAVQTFVPQTIVGRVANLPVLSLFAMMALAFLMSLCSESDAFVAASFTQFGPAAQLAFLVSGPMIDLKLGALYAGTYSKGFVRVVVVTVVAVTLAGTLWLQVVFG
ncbi:MAG: permease [Actinomycetota bacterium]